MPMVAPDTPFDGPMVNEIGALQETSRCVHLTGAVACPKDREFASVGSEPLLDRRIRPALDAGRRGAYVHRDRLHREEDGHDGRVLSGEGGRHSKPRRPGTFSTDASSEFSNAYALPIDEAHYNMAAELIKCGLDPNFQVRPYDLRLWNCTTFALWFLGAVIGRPLTNTVPGEETAGVQPGTGQLPVGNPNGNFYRPDSIDAYFKQWARLYAGMIILNPNGTIWTQPKKP